MTSSKRALTGIRATGVPHIGNYFGTIRPALELQAEFECFYFIADLHALTTNRDGSQLREQARDVAAAWLACGLDPTHHVIYRQSDLPMVTEFAWYLSCVTGVGFLQKGHAYKDSETANRDVNHGILAYPVLMAADIIMYDVDVVPVGKDQKQHVEMARDMAGSFNAIYGPVMKLPEVRVEEEFMLIPGLDGRKMSKSYGNTIPLFLEPSALKKLIMGMKTDSTPVEAPKSLAGTLIGDYVKLFATNDEAADMERRLQAGGLGWGHVKAELFELVERGIGPLRPKFREIRDDVDTLERILSAGAERAYLVGRARLDAVRQAVGMSPHRRMN